MFLHSIMRFMLGKRTSMAQGGGEVKRRRRGRGKKPIMTEKQHHWVRSVNMDKRLDSFFEKKRKKG